MSQLVHFLLAFLIVGVMTPILAQVALRWGWIDRREDKELRSRKPREQPVPLVGGAAIVLALACLSLLGRGAALPWPALLAALALGTLDDRLRSGLRVPIKLAGQAVVAALVAFELGQGAGQVLGWFLLTGIALNAANTFDNADGALAGVGALAFGGSLGICGALLGFLPWNLARRDPTQREPAPIAYLGDAGSHVVGVLWAATPSAWPVLALPLLDLARLWRLRRSLGQAPWVGDRRHLAHRLEARGLGREFVVGTLVCIAAPSFLLPDWASAQPGSVTWLLAAGFGVALTGLLYVVALRATRGLLEG